MRSSLVVLAGCAATSPAPAHMSNASVATHYQVVQKDEAPRGQDYRCAGSRERSEATAQAVTDFLVSLRLYRGDRPRVFRAADEADLVGITAETRVGPDAPVVAIVDARRGGGAVTLATHHEHRYYCIEVHEERAEIELVLRYVDYL